MTLNNIYEGMNIKNYKQFCELLNEPIKGGKAKQCQLEKWKRAIKFHRINKIGYQIDNIIGIDDNTFVRKQRELAVKTNCFKVPDKNRNDNGVYIIYNQEGAYIGATSDGIRRKFLDHYNNSNGYYNKTHDILHNNGVFEILWSTDNPTTPELLQEKKRFYIENYIGIPPLINSCYHLYPIHNKEKKDAHKCIRIPINDIDTINKLKDIYSISKITANYIYLENNNVI